MTDPRSVESAPWAAVHEATHLAQHAVDLEAIKRAVATAFPTLRQSPCARDAGDESVLDLAVDDRGAASRLDLGCLARVVARASSHRARLVLCTTTTTPLCIRVTKPVARHWAWSQIAVPVLCVVVLVCTWTVQP